MLLGVWLVVPEKQHEPGVLLPARVVSSHGFGVVVGMSETCPSASPAGVFCTAWLMVGVSFGSTKAAVCVTGMMRGLRSLSAGSSRSGTWMVSPPAWVPL